MTDRRRAYRIVDMFEQALCEYTGAPYCVATDCCTNAIYLALRHESRLFGEIWKVVLPSHTYVGVVQAVRNAGGEVIFQDRKWQGSYQLGGTSVVDSAKRFERDMYQPGTLTCLSFGASKLLPIGRGGAILTDNQQAADWIRPRSMDGRTPGADYKTPSFHQPGYRMNMTPEQAARGLELLTYIDDNDQCDYSEYPDLSQATWV